MGMPFKPSTSREPEVFEAELVDDKPGAGDAAVDDRPILPTLAQFLAQAAPIVGRIDQKRGVQVAAAAVGTQVLANEVDDLTATGKQLIGTAKRMRDKYTPVVKKALTPGLERRALVDMHREKLGRNR